MITFDYRCSDTFQKCKNGKQHQKVSCLHFNNRPRHIPKIENEQHSVMTAIRQTSLIYNKFQFKSKILAYNFNQIISFESMVDLLAYNFIQRYIIIICGTH